MKIKGNIFGIAEALTAAVLLIGSLTFFKACGDGEERHMVCHWAQNAVTLSAAVLVFLSLLRVFIPGRSVKAGIAFGLFAVSVSVIFIPGTVIDLCMMDTMRCHTIFKPAVIAAASVLTVISGIDAVIGLLRSGKEE